MICFDRSIKCNYIVIVNNDIKNKKIKNKKIFKMCSNPHHIFKGVKIFRLC